VAPRKAAARPDADLAGLPGGGGPVGRDDVLAQLRFAAEEAVTGRGELILLTGEAGIGKTTMLSEAARYAETRGIRVAWGFCGPDDSAPAYWPWAQVARELCPEAWAQAQSGLGHDVLPEPDAQAVAARFRLFDLVTAALLAESRIQPDLILLDDLQWADEASLLFLDFFIRRLRAGSAAVIGAYRDVSPAPGAALIRVSARGRVLPLTGLAAADVARLVARVAGQPLADSAFSATYPAPSPEENISNPVRRKWFVQIVPSVPATSSRRSIPPRNVHETSNCPIAPDSKRIRQIALSSASIGCTRVSVQAMTSRGRFPLPM